MKPRLFILLGILACLLLIGSTCGSTTVTGGDTNTVTANGPLGILVSLGFEYTVSISSAIWFYNIIGVGSLLLIGSVASERNLRFFGILLPMLAALLVYIGWLQSPNPTGTWAIIIGMAFLGGMLYMKESLRENWGIGGPGSTALNIAIFLIIFQVTIGVVNSAGVFSTNVAVAPQDWNQTLNSVNIQGQVSSMSNSGGLLTQLWSTGSLALTMALGALQGLIAILQAVFLFSTTMQAAFPALTASPVAMSIIYLFNIGEILLFAKLLYDMFYIKSPWVDV
jgi:hypothetical protein